MMIGKYATGPLRASKACLNQVKGLLLSPDSFCDPFFCDTFSCNNDTFSRAVPVLFDTLFRRVLESLLACSHSGIQFDQGKVTAKDDSSTSLVTFSGPAGTRNGVQLLISIEPGLGRS